MVDMVFNALSAAPTAVNVFQGRERMANVVSVLLAAPSAGFAGVLRTDAEFYCTQLGPDYNLSQWVEDGAVSIETRRFVLELATKAPYLDGVDFNLVALSQSFEISFGGCSSEAFSVAHVLDCPLLSFNQEPWDEPILRCSYQELTDAGEVEEGDGLSLINLSHVDHLILHRDWIQSRLIADIESLQELWDRKDELLAHLRFCPSVEGQLIGVGRNDPRYRQIVAKLFQLNDYFSRWKDGGFDPKQLPKCNPASKETLKRYASDYSFDGPGGDNVVANWHVYFTPGAGRIYFDVDPDDRIGKVCHVGGKLPDATYGTH